MRGAVVDPFFDSRGGDGRERIEVAINRKTDLLEEERSHRHISEAAYRTGRAVQAVLERASRVGSSNWAASCRLDPLTARGAKEVRLAEGARTTAAFEARIRDRLGMVGTRLLQRILGDGLSYAQCAALQGKAGERGVYFIRMRFREALEDLAEAFAAKGKAHPAPDDCHRAAAETAATRQAAAIAGGASRRRYGRELREARGLAATAPTVRERRQAADEAVGLEARLAWLGNHGEPGC